PGYFLGGAMKLDHEAALRALSALGVRLGLDARSAARGVLRYAVAQMSHALRLVTLRRGYDPRDFAFIAYGGAARCTPPCSPASSASPRRSSRPGRATFLPSGCSPASSVVRPSAPWSGRSARPTWPAGSRPPSAPPWPSWAPARKERRWPDTPSSATR